MATPAYRNLLRAARIAFQGDNRVLTAAREQIRTGFREKASLPKAHPSVAPSIEYANEMADFLKANVVQGKQEADGETYRLRIHEHTERGDNDTVKLAGGKTVAVGPGGSGCCSTS